MLIIHQLKNFQQLRLYNSLPKSHDPILACAAFNDWLSNSQPSVFDVYEKFIENSVAVTKRIEENPVKWESVCVGSLI